MVVEKEGETPRHCGFPCAMEHVKAGVDLPQVFRPEHPVPLGIWMAYARKTCVVLRGPRTMPA